MLIAITSLREPALFRRWWKSGRCLSEPGAGRAHRSPLFSSCRRSEEQTRRGGTRPCRYREKWRRLPQLLVGSFASAWICFLVPPPSPAGIPLGESTNNAIGDLRGAQTGDAHIGTTNRSEIESAELKREAVDLADRVAKTYPNDALSYALLGSAHFNTGRSDEASKDLTKCVQLNPNLAEAYEMLARIAYAKGELEETARLCQESLKRDAANPEVLNLLGRSFMDRGQTEEAVQALQQAVHLPRPISQSSYLLGQAKLQSGKYAEAKESFERAIALMPDHTQAYFGLFTACSRLGQTDEAARYRERFQKLEAIDRQSLTDRSARDDTLTGLPMVRATVARTFFGAGQIYQSHGEGNAAADLFRKSALLDGENAIYRAALEAYYVQTKALLEGVVAFQQLVAAQPSNHLNYLFLGRMHTRLDQPNAAETAYRRVQELAPQWAEGYRAMADLFLRVNRKLPEAQVLAQRVVELAPTASHYYLLAMACVKNGDRAAALQAAQKAAAMSPGDPKYQRLLQQLNGPR